MILDLLPTHGVTFFPASCRRHIDNFLEAAEVIREAGLYGWRGSGHLDSKPIAWGTIRLTRNAQKK